MKKIKEIKISISKLNTNDDKAVLIQDPKVDFKHLSEEANRLIRETENENKFEEIHYDNVDTSRQYFVISIAINIVFISLILVYCYFKFYSPNTWAKVANILSEKDIKSIPKFFVQKVYPKSPYPKRRFRNGRN